MLFSCYRLGNLVESDSSDSDSEMSIISEGESDKEEHDQATVYIDSFERVRGQLGGNVTENAISCLFSQLPKWNSNKIPMLIRTTTVQNFIWCAVVIEMYEYTLVNFKAVFF